MGSLGDSGGLSILNPSPIRLPGTVFLHEVVSRSDNKGDSAIEFLSKTGQRRAISYPELHAASDALAFRITEALGSLSTENTHERLIIPLLIPQSPELYIALLAILKVGGAFCPLNLDAPKERIKFILKDVEAKVVLVSSSLSSKIPQDDSTGRLLLVEESSEATPEGPARPTQSIFYRTPKRDDLAYVMYTSGSTGTPKGVGVSHDAATQSLLAHNQHIPNFKRFLQFAAPTFDVSAVMRLKRASYGGCMAQPRQRFTAFVLEHSEEGNTEAPLIVAPLGHVGELAVGGFQLAAGYINRPEQTSAAFIETSWGRLYRTGDKARMHSDGTLECLGRIDDAQVKLNGQRIELGEVEQAILRARGCHSAFATVISNVLVAFAAVEDAEGIQEQILANCKSWLPAFMIPAEIITMRDFPQLPSGKIDRKRLIADHEASMAVDDTLEEQFSSDLERQLCEAGREILGSLLTPSTRLVLAGLDSLMGIKYASILLELGIFVSPVDILESPTIRDLCSIIQRRISKGQFAENEGSLSDGNLGSTETESSHWLAALGTLAEQVERVDHCTALQTSMIAETLKDNRLYVNQVELEFPQRVSAESIKIWIACIAERNEVLRTGFLHIDSTLRQVIWKHLADRVQIVEKFSHLDSYDVEQFLQHPLQVEIRGPTGQEAPCRARFTLHHSIYDGWTMDLLIEDLRLLSLGQEPVQRPQFRTASRCLDAKSDHELMSSKEFWAENLRGSTPAPIPNFKTTAVPHPQIVTEVNDIQIDPAEVKQWALQSSFSPQVIFQACLCWLWAAVTGSDDVILGSVSSGRTLPIAGIEKIMGPFIATLPLRISLSKYQNIGELLQSIHIANRESLRHGRLPLPDLKRAAGLSPATRLFNVIFAYQESLVSRRQYPNDIREVWHKDAVEYPSNVPDVKFLVTSGEPMTDEVLGKWADTLYQGYGPSETTNICTVRKVAAGDSSQFLGWSFENTATFVCYPNTPDLVPLGCVGELCFGGDQVAAGYLKLPEMTAEKFFKHPEYGRLYRSGDLGRMLSDGSLIILGRMDTQVKLRGLRIELQEIQSIVLSIGLVRTCTTLPVTLRGSNTQHLALFYVPVGEVSRSFGFLDITDSAKHSNSEDDQDGMEDEWTEAETAVAKALANTLDMDQKSIGRWTSFAAIGIDSISAMPLARELQSVCKTRVPLSLVIQNPSVGRLAAAIAARGHPRDERQTSKNDPLLPTELTEIVRKQLRSQGKPIPSQSMLGYWATMIRRHEILRACFVTTDDFKFPIVQVVFENYEPTYHVFEASEITLQQEASRHLRSLSTVINSGEPPISLAVIRIDDSEYLSFVCHHAVYDGISMRNLLSEVEKLAHDQQLSIPLLFEVFLRETLPLPPDVDDFWGQHLQGIRPLHLDQTAFKGDTAPLQLATHASHQSLTEIEIQLKNLGVSLLSFSQAAWAVVLSLLQKGQDVCFGNVVSGRSVALDNIDTLVAPCFNTVPIRMDLANSGSTLELLKKFHSLNIEMLPYQFTGLRRIQSRLQLSSRLFDTLLILQPQSEPLDETVWILEEDRGVMDVPIICELTPIKEQNMLGLQLHRSSSMFSYQTLELIRDVFQHVFDDCLAHPSSYFPTRSKLPLELQGQIAQLDPTPSERETPIRTPESSADEGTWSKEEMMVRSVLSKLANVPEEKIERHMPIYRFGLDSIGAVQLAASLRRQDRVISAADIMANPTCAGIASCIEDQLEDSEVPTYDFEAFRQAVSRDLTSVKDLSEELEAVFPCSPVQQGMLSQFLISEGKHYFNFSSWTLNVGLDADNLVQAWEQLVTQHQILRTGFVSVNHSDSSFAMVVYPPGFIAIPVTRSKAESVDIRQWRVQSAQGALRTLSWPPWRVLLVDRDAGPSTMHLAMHHALYDAHSLRELLHDLACFIEHKEVRTYSGVESAISQLFRPMDSQRVSEAFWKSQAESLVINSFPTLTPLRVQKQTFSAVSAACGTSLGILQRHAADAGITIQAALQAAWTRLLSAYHGELTVTFGVVFDGRTTEESKQAVFPMISTLPVIAQNFESNLELLHSMLQYNATLRRYEHTPLPLIQRWLGRPDSSLFDTILVYQVADQDRHRLPWTILDEAASVDYPVSLEVEETIDKLQFNLTFDDSVLPAEQAEMMLEQLNAIFVDLVTCPGGHSHRLASQTPKLYSVLPPAHPELSSSAELLHQLVEKTVQARPDSLALEFVDELTDNINRRRWTYRELDAMGNRVANILHRHHIPSKSIVAICFDKCPEAYFSILGILKAGYSFLALDPSAPSSRQEFILRDSKAACLLIAEAWHSNLSFACPVPILEVGDYVLLTVPTTLFSPSSPISPSDTCYCLYTSGTTGTPKGCLISHDNAVQAMQAFKELFSGHWDSQSRWLQFASFHFDVSVLEQYWSWFVGITVVAAPRDLILNDLIKTISKLEITHIDLTPSLARLVHPDEAPSLCRGVFITGGEQLRQDVLDNWGPTEVIYNAYGPTEATIGVTMFQRVPANGRSSNIGHLFPNVGGYVFHPGTEIPVFRGGVGELCVSGRLVGKGYLNRQQLTRERFPVLKQCGDRVYRTGDLVRVLHDGSIDFLGRADDQVKLRGQRLEIGEINHAIKASVSQVADVATLVTRHGSQDRDLIVSFVAPRTSSTSSKELHVLSDEASLTIAKEAQGACRERVPGYMVPTFVFTIPFIPLSANNKANLNSLKQLFSTLSSEQLRCLSMGVTGTRRELSNREHRIASVLSTITRAELSSMQPSSTIFELGIDSITVTRVARSLQAEGFPSATPSLILKNPRISRLAQVLGQENAPTLASQVLQVKQLIRARYHKYLGLLCRTLEIANDSVEYIAPCTPLQGGMLTRSRTTGDHSAYFNHFRISLSPLVATERLKDAWTGVVSSCSILRTAFIQTPEGYVQAALKGEPLRWSELDIQDGDIEECISARHRTWVEMNQDAMRYPLELDYIHSPQEHVLVLRLFHAVYDAHSFELILRKVIEEYHETCSGYGPSFLDVLPHGPLFFHSSSRPFWEALFKSYAFEPLPRLTSTPSTSDTVVSRIIGIDGLEVRRIALGVTHQTMMQAAWLVVLQQYFTVTPTIGVVFSGRSILYEGAENVIGPMFNTLPFRVETSDITTWGTFVRKVHEYNTSVLDFVHTPLRDIQKWCSRGRQLFDTLFTFDREYSSEVGNSDLWSSISSTAVADYPLALEVVLAQEQCLRVTLVAQAGIADKEALESLLGKLQHSLASLAASDDDTIVPIRSETIPTNSDISTVHHSRTGSNQMPSYAQGGTSPFEWTELAKKLRREIALLAGLAEDEVAETASIFELGLDSIDAIKLAARLNNLGLRVTTSDLMKRASIQSILSSQDKAQPQVNGLAAHDDELTRATSELKRYLEGLGANLDDIETVLPPTPLQDSMVADMLLSGFYRYFNHDVLRIIPGTDMGRLKSAWTTVYDNSPILRTSFEQVEDPKIPAAFCQVVRSNNIELSPTLELGDLDKVQTVIDHARSKAKNANAKSGLFQVNFVTTPTDHSGPASRGFWADFLHGAHPTLLDTRTAMPDMQNPVVHRAEVVSRFTPMELKTLCRTYGITPQVLSQACWAVVLATLVKALDVTFGIVLSGRDTDEAQELMFPTMNTVPMRVVLHGSVTEYLRSLQATMSEVLEFQHVSLRQAQKLAGVQGQHLFNTLFVLQNSADSPNEDPPIMESVQGTSAVEYPICIEMEVSDASVMWRIACDERFGSWDNARRTLEDLEVVLHYVSKNQDAEVVQFEPHNGRVMVCGQDAFTPKDELQFESNAPHETPHDRHTEWSEIDSPVVEVLAQLSGLKKDSINPDDTIYHLGLDSISAIKASSMLRKLGLSVSVRDLLKADSIRQLVDSSGISEERPEDVQSRANSPLKDLDLPPLLGDARIDLNVIEKVLPALPMQVHMLTVWQNTSGLLFYPTFTYKITGCASPDAVANAWRRLTTELPILRTHFVATGSVSTPIIQIITQPESSHVATLGNIERIGERQWRYQAAPTPFAFVTVEGYEPGEAIIRLRIHHALYDGVSLPIVMGRFAELCGTQPSSLSPSSLNAWCKLVSDHSSGDVKRKAQAFWTSYLEGASSPTPSIDRPGSEKHVVQVAELKRDAVPDLCRLKHLASTHGVTLQALFFAAYAKVLAYHRGYGSTRGNGDAVFGIYLANRTNVPGLEDVPFPTLIIVPLRVRSPGSETIHSLAAEIQKDLRNISALESATAGLWEIGQWTGVQIDTFVNFLSLPGDSKNGDKVSVEEVPADAALLKVNGGSLPQLTSPDEPLLSKNPVRDYYVDAVDIEVAVRGESMDIGVFSLSPSYSQAEASEMVQRIVRALEEGLQ
ncbi:hypothetical protein DL766_005305 [Monosporascus sp. MC13-8B]|uniref:Carrier domain-containing protein n=1 Tax=Monosporascus cannonballus TaxID=155416 RepID=A0ABY0GUW7_9PEZI|nr:hypothetical protein DL762_010043 [Monosporascus cannonballus]RYP29572.1 hypothetical protein DL766_005305 [Monosporascus sp. MC13-8B]